MFPPARVWLPERSTARPVKTRSPAAIARPCEARFPVAATSSTPDVPSAPLPCKPAARVPSPARLPTASMVLTADANTPVLVNTPATSQSTLPAAYVVPLLPALPCVATLSAASLRSTPALATLAAASCRPCPPYSMPALEKPPPSCKVVSAAPYNVLPAMESNAPVPATDKLPPDWMTPALLSSNAVSALRLPAASSRPGAALVKVVLWLIVSTPPDCTRPRLSIAAACSVVSPALCIWPLLPTSAPARRNVPPVTTWPALLSVPLVSSCMLPLALKVPWLVSALADITTSPWSACRMPLLPALPCATRFTPCVASSVPALAKLPTRKPMPWPL